MDRRHFRTAFFVVAALAVCSVWAASSEAQLLRGKGCRLLKNNDCGCHEEECEQCTYTPYLLNTCSGQHACCGNPCGCGHSGFCNWCGHGREMGWTLRTGFLLPKCPRANAWYHYYNRGYAGHGGCGGHGCGPGCGGSGSDLFYNYYAPQTGAGGGVTAQMYPSPHSTPDPAIQTYYTYQPWLPHEHLYQHNRNYLHYHSWPYGVTNTSVSWGGSPILRHFD